MGACGGDEDGSSPAPWARSTPGTPCDRSGPACCRRGPCAKREYHRWLPAWVRAATRSVRTRVPPAHTNGSPPFPAIPISILHRLVESDGVVAGGADVIMPVGCGGLPRVGRWWSDLLGRGPSRRIVVGGGRGAARLRGGRGLEVPGSFKGRMVRRRSAEWPCGGSAAGPVSSAHRIRSSKRARSRIQPGTLPPRRRTSPGRARA